MKLRGEMRPRLTMVYGRSLACLPEPLPDVTTLWVDLALGSIEPNAVCAQILRQIGMGLFPDDSTAFSPGAMPDNNPAKIIGAMIDRENTGYTPCLAALKYSELILRQLSSTGKKYRIVLICPLVDEVLTEDNENALRFISERSCPTLEVLAIGLRPLIISRHWEIAEIFPEDTQCQDSGTSESILADLVPGLIANEDAVRLAGAYPEQHSLMRLPNDLWLIPLERRRIPGKGGKTADHAALLRIAECSSAWQRAYALKRLGRGEDLPSLVHAGWTAIVAGAYTLGIELFRSAAELSGDEVVKARLQGVILSARIGLEDFSTMAQTPIPSEKLPPALRSYIIQQTAWGLVMTGRPREAIPKLIAARELLESTTEVGTAALLYLINITALAYLRAGEIGTALALESEMREHLHRETAPDVHLSYINDLNTGRLYLHHNDTVNAAICFKRARDSHESLRTLTDHLTSHIYEARIAQTEGLKDIARWHWLRAALYWVANPAPETISTRAVRLLLRQDVSRRELWLDAVSKMFSDKLLELYSIEPDEMVADEPDISMRDEHPIGAGVQLISNSDWAVLASPITITSARGDAEHRRLRAVLGSIFCRSDVDRAIGTARSLLVDDQLGMDLPCSRAAAIAVGLRLDLGKAYFDGVLVYGRDVTEPATEQMLVPEFTKAVLRLGTDADGRIHVFYRRYLPPRVLTAEDSMIVRNLNVGRRNVRELATVLGSEPDSLISKLRTLERYRIIAMRVVA